MGQVLAIESLDIHIPIQLSPPCLNKRRYRPYDTVVSRVF